MPFAEDGLKLILTGLERFEGRVAYIYNDGATPPNRTVGVGCLLPTPEAACRLPFRNLTAGRAATPAEITADFLRVRALPGGLPPSHYRARAPAPALELADDDITALGVRKLQTDFLPGLRALCPRFDDFPASAQSCLIDLAWNLGLGAPASASRAATGLHGFPLLLAACNRGDWLAAAKESHVASSRPARNNWRTTQLLAAAAAPRTDKTAIA
jgi:hypothetical protein